MITLNISTSLEGQPLIVKKFIGIGKQSPQEQLETFIKNGFNNGFLKIDNLFLPVSKVILMETEENV